MTKRFGKMFITDTADVSMLMLQAGAPTFGLVFTQVDDQAEPVYGANMDVVGLIGPCKTVDDPSDTGGGLFPHNTPILVFSNDTATLSMLGPDGYLADAVNAINAQLADFEIAAQMVIVRTPYGQSEVSEAITLQETIGNIMGNSVLGTGVYAFLKAPNSLYCTPRIIIAPGYTGQMANSLDTLTTVIPGVGYIPNATYQITFTPGNGEQNLTTLVLPVAHAVADNNGHIGNQELFIDSWGAWFSVAPVATMPPYDGQVPPAVAASGQIIFQSNPGIGSKITFNGQDVTFIAHGGSPAAHQVALGVDLGSTLIALATYLNGTTGQADPNIGLNDYLVVTATYLSMNIMHHATGTAGNLYTLATTVTGAVCPPHLTGGVDVGVAATATLNATMALGANPIVANLGGVLDTLIAHAIVESAGTSIIDDENWRDTINHQRIIPLSGGVKILSPWPPNNLTVMPMAPRVAGLMVARDFVTGYPFHSCANQPIQGIVGPARTIGFSLTDGATEGQVLLAANLGILVRGLIGVETAISSGGFIFIGTDNAGDDPLWQMYNVKRGRDYIHLSLMPVLRTYLGRTNIQKQTITNILATIEDFLGDLTARQQILGYKVNFQGSLNSSAQIRLGHLTVGFQAEEPPVLKRITTMSARYAPAIDAMVSQLEQQLALSA